MLHFPAFISNYLSSYNCSRSSNASPAPSLLQRRPKRIRRPLFYLADWLTKSGSRAKKGDTGHVVIVGIGNQRLGFVVDELIGQEEVVIKPLGDMLQGTKGLAGATITGDGRIALILDVPSLLEAYAGKF